MVGKPQHTIRPAPLIPIPAFIEPFSRVLVDCVGPLPKSNHQVGQGHVTPRDAKVRAIVEFPAPSSKRELLRFLGMCGFYRKFVPNFSHLVVPLTDLLKKGTKFEWSVSCQTAFQKLKDILMNDPVLVAPNFGKSFQLATDANDRGVGAVLLQDDANGHSKYLCYFSKKLNRHQQKYSTVEKECLSVVLAV